MPLIDIADISDFGIFIAGKFHGQRCAAAIVVAAARCAHHADDHLLIGAGDGSG
jgi:hypothetical protein